MSKTIEAAVIKEIENCDLELIQLLIILNLAMTALIVLIKIKNSRTFQGHLFTNMVKINLFLANTQSYVPLELNSAAGNVHLFNLSGTLAIEHLILKKKMDMGCAGGKLEQHPCNIKWQRNQFPGTLTILFAYKLKARKLFMEKNSLHVYIMLKHRKSWYNLENEQD